MAELTPSQTVGPWFAYGLTPNKQYDWSDLATGNLITPDVVGERIRIEGRVLDGDGIAMKDAMIEIWQADAQGRYADPRNTRNLPNTAFKGHGRSATDAKGMFGFDTVRPGAVPGPDGKPQAPHIVFAIFSRGMLRQVYTRMYFADEKTNAADPVLALVPADRRDTLIAMRETRDGKPVYRFDIRVQGGAETVFFEV